MSLMVAIGFAVRCHVYELWLGAIGDQSHQAVGEPVAVVEETLESNRLGRRSVVEEHDDRAITAELHDIGHGRIDPATGHVRPVLFADRPHVRRLMGLEDREGDPLVGHEAESFEVHGGLGQPHAFGLASEASLEVGYAPPHLGFLVAAVGQGHDHVVVDLSDGGPVPSESFLSGTVGGDDGIVDVGCGRFHPRHQRRTDVEAHPLVVGNDAEDAPIRVEDPAPGVRGGSTRHRCARSSRGTDRRSPVARCSRARGSHAGADRSVRGHTRLGWSRGLLLEVQGESPRIESQGTAFYGIWEYSTRATESWLCSVQNAPPASGREGHNG